MNNVEYRLIESGVYEQLFNATNIKLEVVQSDEPVKTPYVDLDENKIVLQENFISFLWAFIFSAFVMYEEGVQKKLLENSFEGQVDFNNVLVRKSFKLFKFATSLTKGFVIWSEEFPNPYKEKNSTSEEVSYSEKVNSIFIDSLLFLILHEVGHIVLRHKNILAEKPEVILEAEQDADNFAFDNLFETSIYPKSDMTSFLGAYYATLASFFLTKSKHEWKQKKHPDIPIRALNIIEKYKAELGETFSFWMQYNFIFIDALFVHENSCTKSVDTYETVEEAINNVLNDFYMNYTQ